MKNKLMLVLALAGVLSARGVDNCPLVDLSGDTSKDVVVAEGTASVDQGHPTTATNENGEIIAVWCTPHGGHCGPAAISSDGGANWTRIDNRFPAGYSRHVNCPSIYQLVDPNGVARLWVWSEAKMRDTDDATDYQSCRFDASRSMPSVMSEDGGLTWTEVAPLGEKFLCTMAFTSIVRLKNGNYLGVFHTGESCGMEHPRRIWQSITEDGGFTWSDPKLICKVSDREVCEAYVFRSPDGNELCCIMRDQSRKGCSLMMFSTNEGESWSTPVDDTPWGLTGDRHQGVTLPDGRLVIAFRDYALGSSTCGDFVVWVGSYAELKNGGDVGSSYRVRLLKSYAGDDCGYPGIELMDPAKGEIVATTYIKYWNDSRKQSIVAKRFSIADTDALRQAQIAEAEAMEEGPVEYIQSDGSQWIDTGIINNTATDEVIIEYSVTALNNQENVGIYGARKDAVGDQNFSYMLNGVNWSANFQVISGASSLTHASRASIAGFSVDSRYRAYGSRSTRYTEDAITGDKLPPVSGQGQVNEDTVDAGDFVAAGNAYLFQVNGGTMNKAKIRLYSCKILRSGVTYREFVPYGIVTNGIYQGCLYEKCEEKYYLSEQGGNAFIAGPSLAPEDTSYPAVAFKSLTAVDPMRVSVTYDILRFGEDAAVSGEVSLICVGSDGNLQTIPLETAATATGERTHEVEVVVSADLAQNDIVNAWLKVENSVGKTVTSESLSLKRSYGAQLLPQGYQQLTYAKATGYQSLDTGVYPGPNTAIWLRFAVDQIDTTMRRLFGVVPNYYNSSYYAPCVRAWLRGSGNAASLGIGMVDFAGNAGAGDKRRVMDGPQKALDNEIHEIYASNEGATFDGAPYTKQASYSEDNPLNVTLDETLYLCDWNTTGTGTPSAPFLGRIYGFKVYEGETLVRDFVPVSKTTGDVTEVGFYDLAAKSGDKVFYAPTILVTGQSGFTAGDSVVSDEFTLSEVAYYGASADLTVKAGELISGTLYAAAGDTYGNDNLAVWDATGLTVTVMSGELATGAVVKVRGIPAGAKYLRLYCTTASGLVMWSNPYYLPLVQTMRGLILIIR